MRASRARTPLLPAVTQNPAHNPPERLDGGSLVGGAPPRPHLVDLSGRFAGRTAAECQALQANEFSAHPESAVKGLSF